MRAVNIVILVVGLLLLASLPALSFAADTNVSSCSALDVSGTTYYLNASLSGAGVNLGGGSVCIQINNSNIVLDCNGYSITNDGTFPADGVHIAGGSDNITVRNCPSVNGYYYGVSSEGISGPTSAVTNVVVSNSTVVNDSSKSLYFPRGSNLTIHDVIVYNSSSNCFDLGSGTSGYIFDNVSLTNLIANNCSATGTGFSLYATNVFANNLTASTQNRYGLYCGNPASGGSADSANITVTNSAFYSSGTYAAYINGNSIPLLIVSNVTFQNVSLYSSTYGLYAHLADQLTFTNTTVYSNTYGVNLSDANITQASFVFYNNTVDFTTIDAAATSVTPNIAGLNACFLPSSGTYANYTNLTLSDVMSSGEAYSINWTTNSSTMPSDRITVANKFVNISLVAGAPAIDSISWYWTDSEVTAGGYTETSFELWKYNASWAVQNASPDSTNNVLSISALVPDAGLYGLLQYSQSDAVPPIITLNAPANLTNTTATTMNFNFTATDETATTLNCSLYLDGALNTTNSSVSNGTLTNMQVVGIAQGRHSWYINCSDGTNRNVSATRNFTVDTTAPVIVLNAPSNRTYTSNVNISFNFTATDNLFTALQCSLYLDGTLNTTNSSVSNGTLTNFAVTNIAEGAHSWYVRCNDTLNSNSNQTWNFTVDLTEPSVSVAAPTNTTYSYNVSLPLNYTISDTNLDTCWYQLDGVDVVITCNVNITFNVSSSVEGGHYINVCGNDSAAHSVCVSTFFTIDKTYPTISISSPANGQTYTTRSVTLAYTASDTHRDSCWYSLDGGTNTTLPSCGDTTLTPGNGQHTVAVYVNDSAGNTNSTANSFTVSYTASTSSHESSSSSQSEDLAVSLSPACGGFEVTVTDGGEAVEDAFVEVTDVTNNNAELNPKYTDSNGKAFFDSCDITVSVEVTKRGQTGSEKRLVRCGTCSECTQSSDCSSNQECQSGKCSTLSCTGGKAIDHQCTDAECSTNSDCSNGMVCIGKNCYECSVDADCSVGDVCTVTHTCEPGCRSNSNCAPSQYCDVNQAVGYGACKDVECACGLVVDHACSAYQCCADAACSLGQKCVDHSCIKGDLSGPSNAFVGEKPGVHATLGSTSCANCDVKVESPNGKTMTTKTDANGNLVVPVDLQGVYKVTLLKDGVPIKSVRISATTKSTIPPDNSLLSILYKNAGLFLGLLVLIVLAVAAILYWQYRGKRNGRRGN